MAIGSAKTNLMPHHLFDPFRLKSVEFRNRIFVSPMCQYSAEGGVANDWHLVHLGARAAGGAGLVIAEATAVEAEGRISARDLGLWKEDQIGPLRTITAFIQAQGAVPGIQLAHAGRKASTSPPWEGGRLVPAEEGGWTPMAPSAIPFHQGDPAPLELSTGEIEEKVELFARAAERAGEAGFQVLELHMAHGYLMHQFLSPLSNHRPDRFGGSLENRMRFPLRVAEEVRRRWSHELPLFVRVSATDWVAGGWDLGQTVKLCRALKEIGVDFIDVSTGGAVPHAAIPAGPLFQTPFAEQIRNDVGIATGAVGVITTPGEADQIVRTGAADAVLLGRAVLRDPHWPIHAALLLGQTPPRPVQYHRAID
jgi:2,4-dienoyl-CoA reductase-like NADH-dependent reductase (Old Yellow Enzyme family)